MPSTQETGHTKNVANFENLISFCSGYGATYNPSRDSLKVATLQTLLSNAKTAIADCKTKETAFNNATNARKESFSALKKLGTRIVNAISIAGVADGVVTSAKAINKKLQGQRAINTAKSTVTTATLTTSAAPTSNTASSSQQSYDSLVGHFQSLIEFVSSHAEYNPNETALKVTTLKAYMVELTAANANVVNTNTAWSNSRINRDSILYANTTGLVDIALDVKAYIKSVFGAKSPQFKQISGIEFKRSKA